MQQYLLKYWGKGLCIGNQCLLQDYHVKTLTFKCIKNIFCVQLNQALHFHVCTIGFSKDMDLKRGKISI